MKVQVFISIVYKSLTILQVKSKDYVRASSSVTILFVLRINNAKSSVIIRTQVYESYHVRLNNYSFAKKENLSFI